MIDKMNREQLREKLRLKLGNKKLRRTNKKVRNQIMEKGLKKEGVDLEKLKKDIEAVNKQGGLTVDLGGSN